VVAADVEGLAPWGVWQREQMTPGQRVAGRARIVGGVIRARLDAVETFMNFVYLWSEDDSSESVVEEVPNGVAAAMDGVLGVAVAALRQPPAAGRHRGSRS
jgi:hypothetical protein